MEGLRDAIEILCKLAVISIIAILGGIGYGIFRLIMWLIGGN